MGAHCLRLVFPRTQAAGLPPKKYEYGRSHFCWSPLVFISELLRLGGEFLLVPILNKALPFAVGSTACYRVGPAATAILAPKPCSGFIEQPLMLAGDLFVRLAWGHLRIGSVANTRHYLFWQSTAGRISVSDDGLRGFDDSYCGNLTVPWTPTAVASRHMECFAPGLHYRHWQRFDSDADVDWSGRRVLRGFL